MTWVYSILIQRHREASSLTCLAWPLILVQKRACFVILLCTMKISHSGKKEKPKLELSPFASFWGNLVETSELFVITNSRLSARGLFAVPSDRRMEPPVPSQRLPLTVRCRAVSVQRPAQRCRAVRTWAPSAQLRESPAAAALD